MDQLLLNPRLHHNLKSIIVVFNNTFHSILIYMLSCLCPKSLTTTSRIKGHCFDKATLVKMADTSMKEIRNITINDQLYDGSTVTGIMKLSLYGHIMYNLSGIIVTGLHRVRYDTGELIKTADHPNSKIIDNYTEDIVYCLNTDSKVIKLGNYTFVDWDDLDDSEINKINDICSFIPEQLRNDNIHKYLDNGVDGNTLVELELGTQVKIKDIEIDDILKFGERVLGTIKIDSKHLLSVNEYSIEENTLRCSANIVVDINQFEKINTSYLEGIPFESEKELYQLITDKGQFYINNLVICDYNAGIEKYLDSTEYYAQILSR
jgi:hypothetical protein